MRRANGLPLPPERLNVHHAFYIGASGEISREEAKHACRVLRLHVGDEIQALDGKGGRFQARIAELHDDGGTVEILRALPSNESAMRLTVYQGIPKAEKMELLAQKLTELGVARFVPVRMERCVVKLDAKEAEKRAQRLERIAQEAVKQCGRALPMEIAPAMDFGAALSDMQKQDLLLTPWEEAQGLRMTDVRQKMPNVTHCGIVIGTEGGISEQEIERMKAVGAIPVTLGTRILRTETAAIAAATLAMALWGDI